MIKERKPNRLKGYDYSSDNLYFVTSCVQNRICCFGKIDQNGEQSGKSAIPRMVLNEYGKIAEKQWYWLSEQYPYVILHAFVVMPNHIHGIIEINRNILGTGRDLSLRPKIKSLSKLIGAYKTTVSKQIHLLEPYDRPLPTVTFAWQRSFHEHIIRDEKAFEKISDYIFNNLINWEQDK